MHGQIGKYFYQTLMKPFETSFSKLSENQKIVDIGSTEWQLKEFPKPLITWGGGVVVDYLSNGHNFSTVDPMSTFL